MDKSFIENWQPPSLREKSHSNIGWIVGVIVLIVVIALIIVFLTQSNNSAPQTSNANNPSQTATQQPAQTPAPITSASQNQSQPVEQVSAASAPQMDSNCTVVIGIVPNSIAKTGPLVSAEIKNNGHVAMNGAYFEFMSGNNTVFQSNTDVLAPGSTTTYSVNLNDVATQLGVVPTSFIILPVQDTNACLNQRMIVIQG